MDQLFQVRYNTIDIDTMRGFVNVKGGLRDGVKDVYFVAFLGLNVSYMNDVADMDKVLGQQMLNGNGYYRRISSLDYRFSQQNIEFYSTAYEKWIESGESYVEMRRNIGDGFNAALSRMCKKARIIYKNSSPNASDTMVKNFIVKVLCWMEQIFSDEDFRWNPAMSMKFAVNNVVKQQELIFWYLISGLGVDVVLLQMQNDIDSSVAGNDLKKVVLGEWGMLQLSEYTRPVKRQERVNPVVTIPPRNRTGNTTVGNNYNAPAGIHANNIVHNDNTREKSYEELARLASSVVLIAVHDAKKNVIATGSGIMIGPAGYILTNSHVANGGVFYSVKIEDDDNVYETDEIIKYNQVLDLAVIRIDRRLNAIPIYKGGKPLVRGQKVVAIGSPLGLFNSVSDGIISGFRKIDNVDMIQFTAPISHGSSGGAVLNLYGEVIGISTAGMDAGQNINLAVGYESINMFIRGLT